MPEWWDWITQTRNDLLTVPDISPDAVAHEFFQSYRTHQPTIVKLPKWQALTWSLSTLRYKAGNQPVEVQIGRLDDPDYEVRSSAHRGTMSFAQFLDHVEQDDGNAVYMTAQNSHNHRRLTAILAIDLRPMPSYLTDDPQSAFLWIGKDTETPLHHDLTHNLMCQVMGRKNIRLIAPEYWQHIAHRQGVHSHLTWIDDAVATAYGFQYQDFWINPGEALFLPAGWFHCVKAQDISITSVFTNFIWGNTAYRTFKPLIS